MRYSHFGILCFGALLREAELSSFSLEDLGFEFETSASTADDDLWSDDLASEIVGQNLRASAASASTGLPNLVKKGKSTKVVASRGSADGSKPKIRLSSAVDPEVPFLDISRNAVIEIPIVGRLTIKGVLYEDAEDSQILRAISEDDTPYAVKIQYKTRFNYADMDTEVDTLRRIAGAGAHIVSLVYASGSEFRNAKGKKFKYCVLEMLGESVSELNNRVSVIPEATIFNIARQGIEALRHVHDAGFVHGDVGPGNFVFKGELLKVIDFGYARRYLDPMSGTHVAPGSNPLTPGFPIAQLSVSELEGHFPSRKDDLMRLGEVLLKILDSSYIRHLSGLRKPEDYKARKLATVPSECCRRKDTNMVPFDRYFEIVKSLEYESTPAYDQLKSLFI